MGKIKSLKMSMTITFLMTICVITLLSGITIYTANRAQQEILKKRHLTISSPDVQVDDNEIIGLTRKNPIKSRVLPC